MTKVTKKSAIDFFLKALLLQVLLGIAGLKVLKAYVEQINEDIPEWPDLNDFFLQQGLRLYLAEAWTQDMIKLIEGGDEITPT